MYLWWSTLRLLGGRRGRELQTNQKIQTECLKEVVSSIFIINPNTLALKKRRITMQQFTQQSVNKCNPHHLDVLDDFSY